MSNELTPTERIAVGLFGWKLCDAPSGFNPDARFYRHPNLRGFIGVIDSEPDISWLREGDWPDFTDERLAPYWCDRMQRELEKRPDPYVPGMNLGTKYAYALFDIFPHDDGVVGAVLYATHPQRVAACLRVLEEEGL